MIIIIVYNIIGYVVDYSKSLKLVIELHRKI